MASALFNSHNGLAVIPSLSELAGIPQLQAETRADVVLDREDPTKIVLSIYSGLCSHPDLVKEHLESNNTKVLGDKALAALPVSTGSGKHTVIGVLLDAFWDNLKANQKIVREIQRNKPLEELLKDKKASKEADQMMLAVCHFVFLCACAMTLGVNTFPRAVELEIVRDYHSCPMFLDASVQILKATDPKTGYKMGIPWDFDAGGPKAGLEEQHAKAVLIPEPALTATQVYATRIVDFRKMDYRMTIIESPMNCCKFRHDTGQDSGIDICGACCKNETTHGIKLSTCSGCKKRAYCSAACQKIDWKWHKKECKDLAKSD